MNGFIRKQLANVNAMFENWMLRRAAEVILPENVEILEDIPYLNSESDCHRVDIYRPVGGEKLPVIVNIHGGGMVLCTRKVNRPFCAELAKRGFLVFCVDYPLVPHRDIPGILADVAVGMDWVKGNITAYGGDPEKVYLVGDSAGAFIGTYELAAQKSRRVAAALSLKPAELNIRAAAFISGMFYTAKTDSTGAFLRADFYGRNWRKHPFRPYMDPAVPEVAGNMPPLYLVTAKRDNLRNYTLSFVCGLKKAGITYILRDLPVDKDMNHDFVIIKPESPKAQTIIDEICAFLMGMNASCALQQRVAEKQRD